MPSVRRPNAPRRPRDVRRGRGASTLGAARPLRAGATGTTNKVRPNVVVVVTDDAHYLDFDLVANVRPGCRFDWVR